MLSNENIKGEDLGQGKSFWFCNLAILHMLLVEDEFSWHPINITNYTHPLCRPLSNNSNDKAQPEAKGEELKLAQKTAILRPPL